MRIESVKIHGAYKVESNLISDNRGEFYRAFCTRELCEVLDGRVIEQANISVTQELGAIRGMHFQLPPHSEMKLIRCLRGRVFDVIVDLRKDSPTFLGWDSVVLAPEKQTMIVIPEGCAHGFQTLERDSQLLYMHTNFYAPESEGGIRFDDPMIGIEWPIHPTEISDRDYGHEFLSENFKGLVL